MSKHRSRLFAFLFVLLLPFTVIADPYGSAFQVNRYASANLFAFDIATGANGDSVVLWQAGAQFSGSGYIQRYDATGWPLQSQEWYIGAGARAVAVSGTGNFAIVSQLPDGAGSGVFVTVYNRAGGVVVPQFRVNDTILEEQHPAGIAMNANGQFVVVWTSGSIDGYQNAVYVKRFQANGAAVAPEALVHSNVISSDRIGAVNAAIDGVGNFVVSWDYGDIYSTEWTEVWARRYSANGSALGATFRVNTFTYGDQDGNRIAMNESGAFIIVWDGRTPEDTSKRAAYGQRYSASGTPIGGEFRISAPSGAIPEGLDVAMAPNGSFVVTWRGAVDGVLPQILARGYTSSGTPLGDTFVVSNASNIYATSASIGMDRAGNFFIAWQQHHYGLGDFNYVYGRRYSPVGVVIQPVANGQTVTGLSGVTGSWRYFKVTVPQGHTTFDVSIFGGIGDADLYVRWGALPTLTAWHGRPYLNGNYESVHMTNYPPGDWYIGIYGYNGYSGLSLQGSSY